MKKKNNNLTKRLSVWAVIVAALLMIPYIGKLPWTVGDYIFAAVILFGSTVVYEIATRNMSNNNHRLVVGGVVALVVFLIWGWAVA